MKLKIIIVAFFPVASFGQARYETLGVVNRVPMIGGQVVKYVSPAPCQCSCSDPGVFINSSHDSVFSANEANVRAVFDLGDEIGVVTRDACGRFYAYANLSTSVVRKDDLLQKGYFIGLSKYDGDKKHFCLLLMVSEENRYLSEEQVWNLINTGEESTLKFQ